MSANTQSNTSAQMAIKQTDLHTTTIKTLITNSLAAWAAPKVSSIKTKENKRGRKKQIVKKDISGVKEVGGSFGQSATIKMRVKEYLVNLHKQANHLLSSVFLFFFFTTTNYSDQILNVVIIFKSVRC